MVNKNIALLAIIFLITSVVKAEITLSVDRNPIRVNETFELILQMATTPISRPPLNGLPDVFETVSSSNFYQSSTINGKTITQAGWRFILRANEEGIFTIPAFEIEGKKTTAIQVKVLPPVNSTNIAGQQGAIRLTTEVDQRDVYVQQQIIFTIRLYRAVQAQYASLTEPEMDGAILQRLGEDQQYETTISATTFVVLERRYAIFPQHNGHQTISPVTFTAEVADGARRYSTFGRVNARTRAVSLSTEPIEINVNSRPSGILNWWLPAEEVTLSEQWLPEPISFRVGEPVTWSYTIQAKGLSATQLPELLPDSVAGFKFYPDTAQSKNASNKKGVTGLRTQKIAVVPTKAGKFSLPEIKVSWWDIQQDKAVDVTLPPRIIEVLPAINEIKQPFNTGKLSNDISTSINNQPVAGKDTNAIEDSQRLNQNPDEFPWKMLAIISLLLWIISALFLTLRNKHTSIKTVTDSKLPMKPSSSMKDIKQACQQNSPSATKKALLDWCSTQKGFTSIHSLAELVRRIEPGALAEQLTELERALYSGNKISWQGKALFLALKQSTAFDSSSPTSKKKSELPSLHLSGR